MNAQTPGGESIRPRDRGPGWRRCPGAGAARRPATAFSLIELLIVVAIIGLLAALTAPAIRGLSQTNSRAAAERQFLSDLGLARLLAIKNRTRVYVIFAPANLRSSPGGPFFDAALGNLNNYRFNGDAAAADRMLRVLTNVFAGPLSSYAIVAAGAVGDQPGQTRWRYLQDWRTLPDGVHFPAGLFQTNVFLGRWNPLGPSEGGVAWRYFPFPLALNVDYAKLDTATRGRLVARLPHIGFEPTGRMVLESQRRSSSITLSEPVGRVTPRNNELWLGLAEASAFPPRNRDGTFDLRSELDVIEAPPGNFTNSIIKIAALTGRAKLERPRLP